MGMGGMGGGMGGMGGAPGMPGMPGQGPDWKKLFDTEKGNFLFFLNILKIENMEFVKHKFSFDKFEDVLIAKMKKNLSK